MNILSMENYSIKPNFFYIILFIISTIFIIKNTASFMFSTYL
nr:MAG TPA: hypothetical protein [Caudoviricetes sp.]